MGMKVKFFESPTSITSLEALETEINEFIADKRVVDIKISTACALARSQERTNTAYLNVAVLYYDDYVRPEE